jgi:hypothetical protein
MCVLHYGKEHIARSSALLGLILENSVISLVNIQFLCTGNLSF